ncbi:hypothetical protein U1Q18_050514 [Sarracenia purpurea var. burkii]
MSENFLTAIYGQVADELIQNRPPLPPWVRTRLIARMRRFLNTQDAIPWTSEATVWRDLNRLIEEQLADGLPVPEPEPAPAPEVQIEEEVVNAEDIENNENETGPDIQESEEELRQKLTDLTLKKPPASFFQSDFIGDIIYLTWLTVVTTAIFCILYLRALDAKLTISIFIKNELGMVSGINFSRRIT